EPNGGRPPRQHALDAALQIGGDFMLAPTRRRLPVGEILTVAGVPGQGVDLRRIRAARHLGGAILEEEHIAREDEFYGALQATIDRLGQDRLRLGGDLRHDDAEGLAGGQGLGFVVVLSYHCHGSSPSVTQGTVGDPEPPAGCHQLGARSYAACFSCWACLAAHSASTLRMVSSSILRYQSLAPFFSFLVPVTCP